jgi:peptidoglycan/LPS O-acetylase OafA/YrhL
VEISSPPHRLPALDGLRGLAILMVMLCHFTWAGGEAALDRAVFAVAQHGTMGVDLFFVLSGFLITGILLDARGSTAYFRPFYVRRVLRLLPLYYLAVGVLVLLRHVGGLEWWYWTHSVNWLIALRGDFTAAPAWTSVFWSLSVEEQFYLGWPLVVWWLSPGALLRACVAIAVVSLAARLGLAAAGAEWATIYTSTLTRLDPLAVGGALAVLARSHPDGLRDWLPAARRAAWVSGALFVAVTLFGAGSSLPALTAPSVGIALLAVFWGAVLVTSLFADRRGPWSRLLESRTMRALGTYSYGLYVVHTAINWGFYMVGWEMERFPVVGGSQIVGQLAHVAAGIPLSFAVAWVSYHGFERHFLRLKRWVPMGRGGRRAGGERELAVSVAIVPSAAPT